MKEVKYDISVVLGSKNRKKLLIATIDSIRNNGFSGNIQIIVIDGGSTDGTCDWLARQKDIVTIVQPNYKIMGENNYPVLAHSWGEFMNIGFRYSSAPYIVMVSDDLILQKGCLQIGFNEIENRIKRGEKIGAGAFFFREYPRHNYYRVGLLPKNYIALNHGFYVKEALEEINYLDEVNYNFYAADGDVIMRLNESGWKSIALSECFAIHLCHKPIFNKRKNYSLSHLNDIAFFKSKYPYLQEKDCLKKIVDVDINAKPFIKNAFMNVFWGCILKYYDGIKLIREK